MNNTQLKCVKCIKNSWMIISSVKSLSYYYSCQEQLSPFVVKDIWELSHVLSCLFRQVYINQCKFLMSCLIPRSSSTYTACTTMYYKFFNVWNKLLRVYIRTSVFVYSNVSNIQWGLQFSVDWLRWYFYYRTDFNFLGFFMWSKNVISSIKNATFITKYLTSIQYWFSMVFHAWVKTMTQTLT